jgi:hypothetical protein
MKQYNPFENVLGSNQDDCLKLYAVVQSLLDYPKLHIDEYDDGTENKLYATAFAYICHDFLVHLDVIFPHEDFGSVADHMNFQENEKTLLEIADRLNITYNLKKINEQKKADYSIEFDTDDYNEYNELVYEIISKYREKISYDIKLIFVTEDLQLSLFGSIFNMNLDEYHEPTFDLMSSGPNTSFLH